MEERVNVDLTDAIVPDGLRPHDVEADRFFELRNPLSLFYPYRSSDDDMHIDVTMQSSFDAIDAAKGSSEKS